MNKRALPEGFTIDKSNINGLGLFATRDLLAMTTAVTHIHHPVLGWLRTALGAFINHSDTPNCVTQEDKVVLKNIEAVVSFNLSWALLGTRDNTKNGPVVEVRSLLPCDIINEGDEITLFYGDKTYHDI